MSNYNLQVSWSNKDALSDSDPDKIISGDDFHTEFTAVQTAVNSKADLNGDASEAFNCNTLTATTATATTTSTTNLNVGGTAVTSTAAELNLLDGKSFLDEDGMASDSATGIPSQQSVKAYVDTAIAGISLFDWTVTEVNTTFSNSHTYTVPANAIGLYVNYYHSMSSNKGSSASATIKDSESVTLHTFLLSGGNENNGTDGGSGLSTRASSFIPLPSSASTVVFARDSGSNTASGKIEAVVKKA